VRVEITMLMTMACFFSFILGSSVMLYILKSVKRILSEGGMLDV